MKIASGLKRILANTSWIVLDRAIRLGAGLFVGVWVARYLGPSLYGVLSFGIAWVALFSVLGHLGLEGIVVRDIVADTDSAQTILGTATALRILGGTLVVLAALTVYGLFYGWDNHDQISVIVVVASAQVFLSAEVIDYWFRSRVEWKYVFRARMEAFFLSTAVKIAFLVAATSVFWIAAIMLLDAALVAGFLVLEWLRHPARGERWRARLYMGRRLLSDSWPNILSGIAIMIYMRIDQIMIGTILTESDVGIYSVAVKLSAVWYMIPMAITQSVIPSIIESKKTDAAKYEQRLIQLISAVFWLSFVVALLITWIGPWAVEWIFGTEYQRAGDVLRIHFWSGIFVALGVATSQWFLAENLLRFSMWRTVIGSVVNVALNLFLIPIWGILGAAVATVVAQSVAGLWSLFMFSQLREIRMITVRAMIPFYQRLRKK